MALEKYDPNTFEEKWYAEWEKNQYFSPDVVNKDAKEVYSIVIPPPNVTGVLHIGHALVNTIQDILIRRARMQGKKTLWVPGTDHAGIATQMVVEKKLLKKGIKRLELGREKFLEEVWEWKEKSGNRIIGQLKRLGASLDWNRECFTMDDNLSATVKYTFCKMYNDGLIYRGNYMTNWCPHDKTAISDLEVNHKEEDGHLYYINYPIAGSEKTLTIATTRPETLLGDTAVAVHPDDERYKDLIGKFAIVPLVNRKVKIIADPYCDPEFGTGVLKITPAHDPNDYAIGKRFDLEEINIFNADGTINDVYPPLTNVDRFLARKKIVALLKAENVLTKTEPHRMSIGRCQRCETIIEPLLSTQWFCRMKDMAEAVLKHVDSEELQFFPKFQTKIFRDWMNNIQDWCISRQLWWGHRIPAWYCENCGEMTVSEKEQLETCPSCKSSQIRAETDVLDTWFSSGLFPFSTLGWPKNTDDYQTFYPNSVLVTGHDILFFWVARMLTMGLKHTGKLPFPHVYLHGLVLDEKGNKMSKSRGNAIDPLAIIDEYGADTLRFTLILLNYTGRNIKLGKDHLKNSRNFLNKIWNAAKFIDFYRQGETANFDIDPAAAGEFDKWILKRFHQTAGKVNELLDRYEFHEAAAVIYHFVWFEFCDWYIEVSKVALFNQADSAGQKTVRHTLCLVFQGILRLIHPFVPYITEELNRYLFPTAQPVIIAEYPKPDPAVLNLNISEAQETITLIEKIRSIRGENHVNPSEKIEVRLVSGVKEKRDMFAKHQAVIALLAKADPVNIVAIAADTGNMSMLPGDNWEVYVRIADSKAVSDKLSYELKKLNARKEQLETKLNNKNFVERAPQHVIESAKSELKDILEKIEKINTATG